MSKKTYLLDPGHGGIVNGQYTTAPNKMYTYSDGFVIYEGVFNRKVAQLVCDNLAILNIDHELLVPEKEDITLLERVTRANNIHKSRGNCVYISIHGNAGGGNGFEIFTSKGQTESDRVANEFYVAYKEVFPERTSRQDNADGDPDKEANFYVLRQTTCPAILTENFFMDNREEAEYMMSHEGISQIAEAIVKGIKRVENYTYEY